MNELILEIFPGLGLLGKAFELEGFTVVRGPDLLWGGDILDFHVPSGVFGGVIGGPPCRAFSRLVHMVRANGFEIAPNLIPEFERVVAEAGPAFFVMENVPAAPEPCVLGYGVTSSIYNNRWAPEAPEQNRERRFSFGLRGGRKTLAIETCAFLNPVVEPAVTSHKDPTPVRLQRNADGSHSTKRTAGKQSRTIQEMLRLQGLPEDYLDEAPFTESGKRLVVGNCVALPMGRAIARAVRRAVGLPIVSQEAAS